MKKLIIFFIPLALLFGCQDNLTEQDVLQEVAEIEYDNNQDLADEKIPYHDIDYVTNYRYCPCWWSNCSSWNGVRVYLTDLTEYWYPQGTLGVYTRNSSADDWVLITTQSYSTPNPFISIVRPPSVFSNSGPQYMMYGVGTSGTHHSTYPANLLPAGGVVFPMNQAGKKCGLKEVPHEVSAELN